jgi:hypothetical protein
MEQKKSIKKVLKIFMYNLNPSNNFDIKWDNLESQVKNTQKFIKQMDGKIYF